MEEILKIYNDGSHFVGTRFLRNVYDIEEHEVLDGDKYALDITYIEKQPLKNGSVYDSKEFFTENHSKAKKKTFTKHETKKYYEDLIKNLIFWHSMADLPYEEIKELVIKDFIDKVGDLVFYVDRRKTLCIDSIDFLKTMFKRLGKNLKERVKRFRQKAYNNKWNYFVTLTYDESMHSESSFLKKIKRKLSNLHTRKGWTYMGVFERSSSGRLHFHGLFNIPENSMIGELIEVSDYSTEHHKKQTRNENNIFKKQFGINDFKSLGNEDLTKGNVLNYILKYIGKTGESIYYSRGIKTFIYIKLNDRKDFITKIINGMATRYVLFDDCLINSIEINVKRMNC